MLSSSHRALSLYLSHDVVTRGSDALGHNILWALMLAGETGVTHGSHRGHTGVRRTDLGTLFLVSSCQSYDQKKARKECGHLACFPLVICVPGVSPGGWDPVISTATEPFRSLISCSGSSVHIDIIDESEHCFVLTNCCCLIHTYWCITAV